MAAHTQTPCDSAGKGKQELRILGSTVQSVLRAASAHGMQSIAMLSGAMMHKLMLCVR